MKKSFGGTLNIRNLDVKNDLKFQLESESKSNNKTQQPTGLVSLCYRFTRAVLNPFLCFVYIWLLFYHTDDTLNRTPSLWSVSQDEADNIPQNIFETPYPKLRSDAFKLGELYWTLKNDPNAVQEEILQSASEILKLKSRLKLTLDQFDNMLTQIEDVLKQQTLMDKINEAFTMVNTMWLVSIIGIVLFFTPAVYVLIKPIYIRFQDFFLTLAKVVREFFKKRIFPILVKCHYHGVYESLFYVICMILVAQGFRTNIITGCYVSLSGMGF